MLELKSLGLHCLPKRVEGQGNEKLQYIKHHFDDVRSNPFLISLLLLKKEWGGEP